MHKHTTTDNGGDDDNGGNGEIKKEDDEGNKDESIFEELVQVLRDRQTASVPHGHHRWVFYMKIPNQEKYERLVIFIKRLISLGWQLIEDNLQISINAENSGHLNFPKYFDISMSNLQSQTFRFKLCTFFAKNVPLFPFVYIHTFSIYCFVTFQSPSPGETKVSFPSQSK